jgi:O-antigen ligase
MTALKQFLDPLYLWSNQHRYFLYHVAIALGVFMIGVWLVPRIVLGDRIYTLLFLLYLLLVVAIVLLRWPILGLISVLLCAMFVPIVGPSGVNAAVGVVAFMLVLWLLKMMAEQRAIRFVESRTILPIFAFVVVSLCSFVLGQLPWFQRAQSAPLEAQVGGLGIVILSLGAFLLVAHLITELRWLKAMTWTFIALGAIYVLGRIIPGGFIDRIYHEDFSAGSMFWTWLVALTFSQAAFNQKLRFHWRVVLVGILLVTFYVAIVQAFDWKSGWLPPLVAIAAMIGIRYKRLVILMIPFALIPVLDLVNKIISTDQYSWGTRLDAWIIILGILKASPLLGLGFANYYWITPLFPIRGFAVRFNSHNQYVDILAQTGVIGLACFLWFFWETGRLGLQLRERAPEGFARAYVYGVLGGLAGTLVAAFLVDWVLPFIYNIGFAGFRASVVAWLFLGGLVSMEQMFPKSIRNESVPSEGAKRELTIIKS